VEQDRDATPSEIKRNDSIKSAQKHWTIILYCSINLSVEGSAPDNKEKLKEEPKSESVTDSCAYRYN